MGNLQLSAKETRGYVPAFIAANYVMTYYCKHNICPMETDIPEATDTVQVSRNLHFEQISDLCGISLDQIKSLNPQFKKSIIPERASRRRYASPSTTSVPSLTSKTPSMPTAATNCSRTAESWPFPIHARRHAAAKAVATGNVTYHKIRSGENLGSIARKYGVTVNQLKLEWIAQYQNLRRKALEDL